ncbi:MAG: hypothetical protein GX166_04700 [Clostridiaceae bacterium]|jgi:hypothetical protein|nr:hypothetical protein [Clostridiaceae bacterium]
MKTYRVSGILVNMEPNGNRLKMQAEPYLVEYTKTPDIIIDLDEDKLNMLVEKNSHLSYDEIEYIYAGYVFYNRLLDFNGFFLHSSAVCVHNKAYLFSAPSGTGKSTHASLWKEYLGDEAVIINDDKPAIRLIEDEFFVFGTPFSGKTALNENMCVKLGAICILERGKENRINRIETEKAIFPILNQTLRPKEEEKMEVLLELLDKCLGKTKVYKLYCNMDIEAAKTAYEAMCGERLMDVLKTSMIKIEPVMNEVLDSGGEFRMIIKGTSMLPLLRQGKDSVVLKKEKPHKHDVVLYKRRNGAFVLHRIIGRNEKGFILCGDNQFAKEYGIGPDDIIAVVSYIIRDDRRIDKKCFKYRLYVRTLMFRRLYKRIKFAVRRVVKD